MAGLRRALPEIRSRGAGLAVIGNARPEAIPEFRAVTGYDGPLLVDPSLRAYEAAELAYGVGKTFHPRAILRGMAAFRQGFRQGARRGKPYQQGGTFVLGPADRVRFEWRDRFAGDHPAMAGVLAALGTSSP